jgi:hypothetical protein
MSEVLAGLIFRCLYSRKIPVWHNLLAPIRHCFLNQVLGDDSFNATHVSIPWLSWSDVFRKFETGELRCFGVRVRFLELHETAQMLPSGYL